MAEELAEGGDPEALNLLATYVSLGVGSEPDEAAAQVLLERAVAAGSIGALLNLGLRLIKSEDPGDQRRALEMLNRAYADSNARPVAAQGLAGAYLFGLGTKPDVRRGVDYLEEADDSDPGIQFLLGRTYQNGWGGRTPDPVRSFHYFERAARMDHPASAWNAGMALLEGNGVEKDEAAAYRWVRRSAEAGFLDAKISTAVMLALGQGVVEDDREARAWYEEAAQEGSAAGLRGLGFMILTGEGGAADRTTGVAYLQLAAEAGDVTAVQILEQEEVREIAATDHAEIAQIRSGWIESHDRPDPAP